MTGLLYRGKPCLPKQFRDRKLPQDASRYSRATAATDRHQESRNEAGTLRFFHHNPCAPPLPHEPPTAYDVDGCAFGVDSRVELTEAQPPPAPASDGGRWTCWSRTGPGAVITRFLVSHIIHRPSRPPNSLFYFLCVCHNCGSSYLRVPFATST